MSHTTSDVLTARTQARAKLSANKVIDTMNQQLQTPTTKDVLQRMLKENTGVALMDSGGEYGRNWQRNQDIDFDSEPQSTFDEYGVTLNVYHWLIERVQLEITQESERLNRMLHAYAPNPQLQDYEDFLNTVGAKGLYGDGEPMLINTCNDECLLSQTLQFALFYVNESPYVALQIHGGADVRGGYTDAYIFALDSYSETSILCYADATLTLKDGSEWCTDDGYNWYNDNTNEQLQYDDLYKKGIKEVWF